MADLSVQRLSIMERIATIKWPDRGAIKNLKQESRVIENTFKETNLTSLSLTEEDLQAFVQMQMDTAKNIQYFLFDRWTASSKRVLEPEQKAALLEQARKDLNPLMAPLVTAFSQVKAGSITDEKIDAYLATLEQKLSDIFGEDIVGAKVSEDHGQPKVTILSPVRSFFNELPELGDQ